MNTPIPKITQKQLLQAYGLSRNPIMDLDVVNKAIEIALAEQQTQPRPISDLGMTFIPKRGDILQESEYITAEQARELGAGNAEFSLQDGCNEWHVTTFNCPYLDNALLSRTPIKYRAIKAQPEPVDPHAALRAEYAKQVSWSDMPVGVMTNKGELREVFVTTYGDNRQQATVEVAMPTASTQKHHRYFYRSDLTLAPASEQPWIARHGTDPIDIFAVKGIEVESRYVYGDLYVFKITGIAKGWELK